MSNQNIDQAADPQPFSLASDPLSPLWQVRLLVGFLLLGIAARGARYLLCFPLWDDETFLCANFIGATYADLLGRLNYHQVAPILFLWAELTAVKLFGFSEWSLRLIPFLCSLASLWLFHRLASRFIQGTPLVLAVGFLAAAYPGIRYAAEAKPYGTDLFVSLVLLNIFANWYTAGRGCSTGATRWLWLLVALVPLAVGFSYPVVFLAGGLSLVVAYVLFITRNASGVAPWLAFSLVLVLSFGGVLWLSATQAHSELNFMRIHWASAFPPLSEPWKLPVWLVVVHASDLLGYPFGGPRGASTATFLCFLAGLWFALRKRTSSTDANASHEPREPHEQGEPRDLTFVLLCAAPLSLQMVAAALQRYPYGGHVKFSQYVAPMICMIAGCGLAYLIMLAHRTPKRGRLALTLGLAFLFVPGVGS
ncbi:MAG: glycosyltransferase family 39 protein, partial [Planctomycetales bacterium]